MAINYKFRQDQVILVTDYGRSGQGWLSFMLCYILNARYIEPYNLLSGKIYSTSETILNLTGGSLPGRDKTDYSLVVKTHSRLVDDINLTDKIIFLVRDPRDVAVSMYYLDMSYWRQASWRSFRTKLTLTIKKYFKILDYIKTVRGWQKHYQSWRAVATKLVQYEDLLLDPERVLLDILAYLNIKADPQVIKEAITIFSFENVAGRPRGQEDNNNTEFRRGIAGDYKNKFSLLELAIVNRLLRRELLELGYHKRG